MLSYSENRLKTLICLSIIYCQTSHSNSLCSKTEKSFLTIDDKCIHEVKQVPTFI